MNKPLFLVICLAGINVFFSCNKEKEGKNAPGYRYDYVLAADKIEKIKADEHTSLRTISCPQIVSTPTNDYFVFFNKETYQIYTYDLNSAKLIKKISLYKDGPNGIGDCTGGIFVRSPDSIFVADGYRIFLLDSMANRNTIYAFDRLTPSSMPLFNESTIPFISNNKMYLDGAPDLDPFKPNSFSYWPTLIELDLQTSEKKYLCPLPTQYSKEIYGPNFAESGFCFNPKTGVLSVTFPISSNIYRYNLNGDGDAMDSIHRYSIHEPNLFIKGPEKVETSFLGRTKFALLSNSYDLIFYDSFRDKHIRLLLKKISEEEFENKEWKKQVSVMILDKDLNVIGEQDLPKNFYTPFWGFTKKHVVLLEWKEEDEDHFYLHFMRYNKK